MSERIGIFGGTFDPPHLGHLILASESRRQLRLTRLLWMLTPHSPHKITNSITRVDWGTNQLEVIAWSRAGGGNPDTRLGIRMAALSDDTFVDIVSAVTETGTNLVRSSWSNTGTTREFGFNTAAQTLNLTLSLTPRRRFELLADPTPLPKAANQK